MAEAGAAQANWAGRVPAFQVAGRARRDSAYGGERCPPSLAAVVRELDRP